MEEELSGGLMEVGIRVSSEMGFRVVLVLCSVRVEIVNMKDIGTMACSMVKEFNFSKTVRSMKGHSKKTSSMETESSTRMIRSFMECGRIMSYQLSTWLNLLSMISDPSFYNYLKSHHYSTDSANSKTVIPE